MKVRNLTLLRIGLEALTRGSAGDGEVVEINGLGSIPVGVARQMLGESILQLVITRGQDVVHVTHLGRGPSAAQRVALLWSQPTCSVEGCPHSYTEIDHRVPWAHDRRTCLGNLDPLCPQHHRLKTFFGWALVDGTGKRPFVPPTDPRHPGHRHKQAG